MELDCSLDELPSPASPEEGETLELLASGAERLELERVCGVLERARALGADLCGIGQRVRGQRPLAFDGMSVSWAERFPTLPLAAEVSCRILRSREGGGSPLTGRREGGE